MKMFDSKEDIDHVAKSVEYDVIVQKIITHL